MSQLIDNTINDSDEIKNKKHILSKLLRLKLKYPHIVLNINENLNYIELLNQYNIYRFDIINKLNNI